MKQKGKALADHWHVRWLREGNPSWNERRKRVSFVPDLSDISLSEVFSQRTLKQGAFNRLNLAGADLAGSDLTGVSLKYANFRNASLDASKLDGADLRGSNLKEASLVGASAKRTNFRGSKFIGASVLEADFLGANVENADFSSSNLSVRQAVAFEKFVGITLPKDLIFPEEWTSDLFVGGVSEEQVLENYRQLRQISLDATRASDEITSLHGGLGAPGAVKLDKFASKKELDRSIFDVYYGTNRGIIVSDGVFSGYGNTRESEIDYGVCEVFVPKSHKIGSLGSGLFKRTIRGDDRLKVTRIVQLNSQMFWRHLRQAMLEKAKLDKPTLFIHGFNNNFEQAVLRAAQIGFDLGLSGGIGLFSWPSFGNLSKYAADEAAMEASKYYLAEFIEDYVANLGDSE